MRIRSPRDFWAGLLFIAIGAGFIALASQYRLGVPSRMGPAYFPIIIGSLLSLLGVAICGRALVRDGPPIDTMALRPLGITLLSVVLFGLALARLGLVVAIVTLVLVGALADRDARPLEIVLLAVFLAAFSVVVFVVVLGLPLQVWPEF